MNLAEVVELIEDKLLWHPDAANDFSTLSDAMKLDVLQQLARITINPKAGQKLENKHGYDLRGYRKMYFWHATYRIVYSIEDDGKCRIWGIGPRPGYAIYQTVSNRIPPSNT